MLGLGMLLGFFGDFPCTERWKIYSISIAAAVFFVCAGGWEPESQIGHVAVIALVSGTLLGYELYERMLLRAQRSRRHR